MGYRTVTGDKRMCSSKMPSIEEVKALIQIDIAHRGKTATLDGLLGMKLVDSFLPKMPIEPPWGYKELKEFFTFHDIDPSCTLEETLAKLS